MEKAEIIIYKDEANQSDFQIEVRVEDDTVWLTQAQMVDLFGRDRTVITKHINNIFKENELLEKSNVHFLHTAISDKPVKIYSLDVIISVGYRVKSQRGTQFRPDSYREGQQNSKRISFKRSCCKSSLGQGRRRSSKYKRPDERIRVYG